MTTESSSSNIEWKKTGFEATEKVTLKTDIQKATIHDAKSKQVNASTFATTSSNLPKGLNKIRNKIKDIYDEDEDENEFILGELDNSNSLLNALHDDEKIKFKAQEKAISTNKMQQDVGKMAAMQQANAIAKDLGLKGLSKETLNKTSQDISLEAQSFGKALKTEIGTKTKIKTTNLSEKETVVLLRGIKKIQSMDKDDKKDKKSRDIKSVEGWKVKDIVYVGKETTNKSDAEKVIAKKLLEKTGRKPTQDEVKKKVENKNKELVIKKEKMRN